MILPSGAPIPILNFPLSTTALGATTTFTGPTLDFGANPFYKMFSVYVFADKAGSLLLEQSRDGTNWRTMSTTAVSANTPAVVDSPIMLRYVRAKYTNGEEAQGAFELYAKVVT